MKRRALAATIALLICLLTGCAPGGTKAQARSESDPTLRVLLRSLGSVQALHLALDGAYRAGDLTFDRSSQIEVRLVGAELYLGCGGMWARAGQTVTFSRLQAESGVNGLRISEAPRDNWYLGDLTLSAQDGAIQAVLALDIETYLVGVVAYEMGDAWPAEALKAQAVAARSYALIRAQARAKEAWDVTDTTSDQVFRGWNPEFQNVIGAVEATRGQVGRYKGRLCTCWYTASNGGQVARPTDVWDLDGDYGYIDVKDDPYDLQNPLSQVSTVTFRRDLSDNPAMMGIVLNALTESVGDGFSLQSITSAELAEPKPSDTRRYTALDLTVQVTVGGVLREATVRLSLYDDIKRGLDAGLNTADTELSALIPGSESYAIELRRYGHGVGMSQRGAQRMAGHENMAYRDILAFYYPGMTIDTIAWQTVAPLEAPAGPASMATPEPTPAPTVTPTPGPLPTPTATERIGRVNLTGIDALLNVRSAPAMTGQVLQRLDHGRQVLVGSEPDGDGWIRVRTAEVEGYCKAEYVNLEP